jgi:hypothetical protein
MKLRIAKKIVKRNPYLHLILDFAGRLELRALAKIGKAKNERASGY